MWAHIENVTHPFSLSSQFLFVPNDENHNLLSSLKFPNQTNPTDNIYIFCYSYYSIWTCGFWMWCFPFLLSSIISHQKFHIVIKGSGLGAITIPTVHPIPICHWGCIGSPMICSRAIANLYLRVTFRSFLVWRQPSRSNGCLHSSQSYSKHKRTAVH